MCEIKKTHAVPRFAALHVPALAMHHFPITAISIEKKRFQGLILYETQFLVCEKMFYL